MLTTFQVNFMMAANKKSNGLIEALETHLPNIYESGFVRTVLDI